MIRPAFRVSDWEVASGPGSHVGQASPSLCGGGDVALGV